MTVRRDSGAVLITGAARRIGRCIALDLARDGWAVAIHCNTSLNDAGTLKSEIEAAGGHAVIVQGDLAEAQVPERLVVEAVAALGPLTCLVNNASRFEPDEAGSVTLDSWAAHLDTNLRAPVFLSQHFAAQLPAERSGNIINIIDQRVWKLTPKFTVRAMASICCSNTPQVDGFVIMRPAVCGPTAAFSASRSTSPLASAGISRTL